jgi:hypothetical protein
MKQPSYAQHVKDAGNLPCVVKRWEHPRPKDTYITLQIYTIQLRIHDLRQVPSHCAQAIPNKKLSLEVVVSPQCLEQGTCSCFSLTVHTSINPRPHESRNPPQAPRNPCFPCLVSCLHSLPTYPDSSSSRTRYRLTEPGECCSVLDYSTGRCF